MKAPVPAFQDFCLSSRFILFTPERGFISEHKTITEARLAVSEELSRSRSSDLPDIYEQIGFDWVRVMTCSEATQG